MERAVEQMDELMALAERGAQRLWSDARPVPVPQAPARLCGGGGSIDLKGP